MFPDGWTDAGPMLGANVSRVQNDTKALKPI